jgi:hypothetical protein
MKKRRGKRRKVGRYEGNDMNGVDQTAVIKVAEIHLLSLVF